MIKPTKLSPSVKKALQKSKEPAKKIIKKTAKGSVAKPVKPVAPKVSTTESSFSIVRQLNQLPNAFGPDNRKK